MENHEKEIVIRLNAKTALLSGLLLGALLLAGPVWLLQHNHQHSGQVKGSSVVLTAQASAGEIYPQFVCTCCGQPLDKNNVCCGIAEEMIGYIDEQVNQGLSEQAVVLATVKKYGLKSLASESAQESVKNQLAQSAPADSPQIDLEPLFYDFGQVSQAKGVVTATFQVKNTGQSDLVINNLLSSCGCTSAALVVNGQAGPRFGMHDNPTNWSATIKAGQSAELNVYYDPNVHPDFRGPATREITVFSNDPVDFEKSIKIKLEQVD